MMRTNHRTAVCERAQDNSMYAGSVAGLHSCASFPKTVALVHALLWGEMEQGYPFYPVLLFPFV